MTEIEPNRLLGAVALLALVPAAASFTPPPELARTAFATPGAGAGAGWFVCDAIDLPYAALVSVPRPDATVDITLVAKARPARIATMRYGLGAASPGAGQVYYALTRNGQEVGNLHQFNPADYAGGGTVRTPTFTSVRLGARELSCRWLADTRFAGVGARRSYVVTQGPQGLAFRAFDYGVPSPAIRPDGAEQTSRATLSADGGTESRTSDGGTTLHFENADYAYTIAVPPAGAAHLTITHSGVRIANETMLGFVFTPQMVAPPTPAVRLASGGWPRLAQGDMWNGYSPYYCVDQSNEACLVRQMSDGGATPPALAFTRRLEAAQTPGFAGAWDQEGPVGVVTVTYPWRAPVTGIWMIPTAGPPLDTDAYELSAADRARPDVRAVLNQFPTAYIANGGSTAVAPIPLADGGQRLLWKSYLTVCDDCQPQGSITVGYDFDRTGRFLKAGVVEMK